MEEPEIKIVAATVMTVKVAGTTVTFSNATTTVQYRYEAKSLPWLIAVRGLRVIFVFSGSATELQRGRDEATAAQMRGADSEVCSDLSFSRKSKMFPFVVFPPRTIGTI